MADYFTHFSCALDVVTADNAARAFELYRQFSDELEIDRQTPGFFRLFATPTAKQPALLWIYDDNASGNTVHVLAFVSNSAPCSASPACGGSNQRTPVQAPPRRLRRRRLRHRPRLRRNVWHDQQK